MRQGEVCLFILVERLRSPPFTAPGWQLFSLAEARHRLLPGQVSLPTFTDKKLKAAPAAAAAARQIPGPPSALSPAHCLPLSRRGPHTGTPGPPGCQTAPTPRSVGRQGRERSSPERRAPAAPAPLGPRGSASLTALRRMPPCVFAAIFCAAARTGVGNAESPRFRLTPTAPASGRRQPLRGQAGALRPGRAPPRLPLPRGGGGPGPSAGGGAAGGSGKDGGLAARCVLAQPHGSFSEGPRDVQRFDRAGC